jgi:formate/nitrite transporter FocA (FNT family)
MAKTERTPARGEREAPGQRERDDEKGEHGGDPRSHLDEQQQEKAEEEESLDADTTHEVIRRMGERELERSASALAWSGLAAGLSMGFSLVTEGLLRAHLPDAPWRPLVAKLGYSVGFLIVILGSQQLFTENTLTPILPLMVKRDRETFGKVATLWGAVLLANIAGAFLFALVIAHTPLFSNEAQQAFAAIGTEAMAGTFGTIFVRAIFAGWLVAIMVWMLPAAESSHVAVIIIVTYVIGIGGFAHIIAGAVEISFLITRGTISFATGLTDFIVPTLLGNVLGGISIVAALNHAQVTSGKK